MIEYYTNQFIIIGRLVLTTSPRNKPQLRVRVHGDVQADLILPLRQCCRYNLSFYKAGRGMTKIGVIARAVASSTC